jgi:ABC-type branched-subunit amino acid transport system substrate-binding protein
MRQRAMSLTRGQIRTMLPVAALSLLTACGTTVPDVQSSLGGRQDSTGTGNSSADGGAPGAVGELVAGDVPGERPGSPTRPTQRGASGDPSPGERGGPAPIVSSTQGPKGPVEIGIQTVDIGDGIAAASAAGSCDASCAGNFGGVSQETMAQAVADWVNAHGGLAGRPIKLVNYSAKVSDALARGMAVVAAEACEYWTKDHHVAALVLPNGVTDDWYACAVRNRLPLINTDYANYIPDRHELRGNGRYDYASANFNLDDTAKYYVSALVDQGFLKPGNKVGLIYKESQSRIYERVIDNTLVPTLRRHGLQLDARAVWNDNTQQSVWAQHVLSFNSKNVDRVLIFGGYNFGLASFAKTAETQNYHPRYGVSSIAGPNEMKLNGVPSSQLRGAQGVGWWTFADVPYRGDAASFNSAAAQCKKIMVAAGQPWTSGTYLMGMKFCDALFLLKTLADRAGSVGQSAFYDAADRLGTGFTSPYMWKTNFRPGDHHGAMYLRNLVFDEPCDCFRYVGAKYLPRW